MSRENFEAWWVSENDGHQPRSSWSALRTEEGYNDEDIDLQWQGYQAATASMQAERDQLAAECAALKESRQRLAEFIHDELDANYPLNMQIETPATDRFLAEQRAAAVDEVCLKISNAIVNCYQDEQVGLDAAATICGDFAAQLRNEVKV